MLEAYMRAISSNGILSDRAKSTAACLDAVQDRMKKLYRRLNLSKEDGVVDWLHGWMHVTIDGWLYVCMDGWMDGWPFG